MSDVDISRERTSLGDLVIDRSSGGMVARSGADARAIAEMMAKADIGIRKHLRGNVGACLAIVFQADFWGLTPYQVGNKSYLVNDQIAYEAQLIQAVIQMRAPIKGRIKTDYKGEGPTRQIRVWAKIRVEEGDDEEIVEYLSPRFADIKPKNSPLWQNDPDQQLHYFGVRSWCRRHFPEVILGVYAEDEVQSIVPEAEYRVIEPGETMSGRLDRLAGAGRAEPAKAAATPAPAAEKPRRPRGFNASYALAELVIEDGIIIKSRDDKQVGGGATEEDESKAQLIVEDGKIVKDVTKLPDAKAETAKPDPVKVTSGKAEPEKKADEPRDETADQRATEREMASAAGAIDPDDDPFAEEGEPEKKAEPEDPLKSATAEFKRDLENVQTEEELEALRKKLVLIFKGVDKGNLYYKEAAAAYPVALNRIRSGGAKATEPEKNQGSSNAGEGLSAEEEDELEQLVTNMDHSPKGIDLSDLHQVRAYVQGLKAAQKGRAITAVPGVYDDVQAACWRNGHTYRSANPVSE